MNKQQGIAGILVLLLVLAVVAGGTYYLGTKGAFNLNQLLTSKQACTQEAKICPDGSTVSRVGPNCEFAECLISDETISWDIHISPHGYSIKYPAELSYSTGTYQGIGGIVTRDTWTSLDNSYLISIFSYEVDINPKLEFNLQSQPITAIQVSNNMVNKVVSVDETLIHVGPLKNINSGYEYMIVYSSGTQENIQGLSLFEKLLSTFKFTSQ